MTPEMVDLPVMPSLAASVALLQDLRLAALTWQVTQGGDAVEPPYSYSLAREISLQRGDSQLLYRVVHEFKAFRSPPGVDAFAEATVAYEVLYSVPDGAELSDADVAAFGSSTVLLSVYPFLRETLCSLTASSGLPVLVLPVLRARLTPPSATEEAPPRVKGGATRKSAPGNTRSRGDTGARGGTSGSPRQAPAGTKKSGTTSAARARARTQPK